MHATPRWLQGSAKSSYLPQISASALGGYQNGHGSVSARSDQSARIFGPRRRGRAVAAMAAVRFRRARGHCRSREQTSLANIAFTAAHQRIIHDVSVAFYRYRRPRAPCSRLRKRVDAVLAAAKSRFQRGIGTVVEVAQPHRTARRPTWRW
jgi:outer membrane protein TolC